MSNDKTLPPLPASDQKSISSNAFDSFYQTRSRSFWGDNEIISENLTPFKKCKHYFVAGPNTAQCKKCSFGLIGFFEVQKGKLYHKGKAVGL